MVSYIGYKSQEIDLYISVFESSLDEENQESSFASNLVLMRMKKPGSSLGIIKAPYHENIDFTLLEDVFETEQIVVSASKEREAN